MILEHETFREAFTLSMRSLQPLIWILKSRIIVIIAIYCGVISTFLNLKNPLFL